jgi:predicted permease
MTFQVDAARSGYGLDRLQAFYRDVQAAGEALPGVTSVGYAWVPVLSGREADYDVVVEGRLGVNPDAQAFVNMVSPDYCQTMGLVLIDGRDFDVRDQGRKTTIAIVNRAFAEHFFGDQSPIGRHIGLFLGPGSQPDMEIVGLVENSLYEGPRQGVRRQVYLPFAQSSLPYAASFYVRTATPAAATYAVLTHAIQKLDPAMPIYEMKTLQTQLDETLGTERLTATLSAAFAGLATVLAAVGLYGVLALAVVRRTKEVGVRMALGASRISVLWMVLREALTLLAAGLAVGIPCAYAVGRYLSSQLFDVAPTDIRVAAAAGAILLAVTGAAALAPARRATAIDPIRALRHE